MPQRVMERITCGWAGGWVGGWVDWRSKWKNRWAGCLVLGLSNELLDFVGRWVSGWVGGWKDVPG